MHSLKLYLVFFLSFLPVMGFTGTKNPDAAKIRNIIESTGINTALCLVLGFGNGTENLITDIAEDRRILVNAIPYDEISLEQARKLLLDSGLSGQVMAEKYGFKELPYVSEIANFVVIEDFEKVSKLGLTRAEALRVLRPGGLLLIKKNGVWEKEAKLWPDTYDDWKQPAYGANRNRVSKDKALKAPFGVKWQDGLPVGLKWAACRGFVISAGSFIALSANEKENTIGYPFKPFKMEQYLSSRDAFNGLPQWKLNCGTTDTGDALSDYNNPPLVTDGKKIYVYKPGKLLALDINSGKTLWEYPLSTTAVYLALVDNILVASCWEEKALEARYGGGLWSPWIAKNEKGEVLALDTAGGKKIWSVPYPSQTIMASDGNLYVMKQSGGRPPKEQQVIALDIKTGKERWAVKHKDISEDPDLFLNNSSDGVLIITRTEAWALTALSALDGKKLYDIILDHNVPQDAKVAYHTLIVNGSLLHRTAAYDIKTGVKKGKFPVDVRVGLCCPSNFANGYMLNSRFANISKLSEDWKTAESFPMGSRGACIQGYTVSYGTLYCGQNWCRCAPGQLPGIVAMSTNDNIPGKKDFEEEKPVEKGPAFGSSKKNETTEEDWPIYGKDAQRKMSSKEGIAKNPEIIWKTALVNPRAPKLDDIWSARMVSSLSAPVVSGGLVYVSLTDLGQVLAVDAKSGKLVWKFLAAGRVDTPPSIYNGLCYFGCRDGKVYALNAKSGDLAWKTAVAPKERKIVAFGQLESVWPAIGSVLAYNGIIYATAGRGTEYDGGLLVAGLDPETGKKISAQLIEPGLKKLNDLLVVNKKEFRLLDMYFDPENSDYGNVVKWTSNAGLDGLLEGSWTRLGDRRSGIVLDAAGNFMAHLITADNENYYAYEKQSEKKSSLYAMSKTKNRKGNKISAGECEWETIIPANQQAEAMILAGDRLLLAGSKAAVDAKDEISGFLWLVSAADGKNTAKYDLESPPVFNGLASYAGNAYITLQNGSLICFGKKQ
ncbi:MAG: PQQ-binding-like beta-propeller repeat protein [Candidatus Firestonebacteria bacterium]